MTTSDQNRSSLRPLDGGIAQLRASAVLACWCWCYTGDAKPKHEKKIFFAREVHAGLGLGGEWRPGQLAPDNPLQRATGMIRAAIHA
jgi:hypothetical protein